MSVLFLKKAINIFVASLQRFICEVSCMDNNSYDEAINIVEYFCFSLVIRISAIELLRMRKVELKSGLIINDDLDFIKCLDLVFQTHPKYLDFNVNLEVKQVLSRKQDFSKLTVLGISNLIDLVIQLQFLILLDPIIENRLPSHFYSFRRGRTVHQALSFLYKNIMLSDSKSYKIVTTQITDFFKYLSHKYIMKYFPFPGKYKKLLFKWIYCIQIDEEGRKKRLYAGVPEGSFIGPLVYNFVLSKLFNNFFVDFPSQVKNIDKEGNPLYININRNFIIYENDIILKVYGKNEIEKAVIKLNSVLSVASLKLNNDKTNSYNLYNKIKLN